jgi:hypothetical protein
MHAMPMIQLPQNEACARGCEIVAASAQAVGEATPGPDADLFLELADGLRRQAATLRGGRPGDSRCSSARLRLVRG